MTIVPTPLDGVFVIESPPHEDERGSFARWFERETFAAHGLVTDFAVSATAFNARAGTVRGFHHQAPPFEETKIVVCTAGRMLDAVVDLRPGPEYGRVFRVELDARAGRCVYVARGCAHGYQTLTDDTSVVYAIDGHYEPRAARGVSPIDGSTGIVWPLTVTAVSAADAALPPLPAPLVAPAAARKG